MKHKIGFVLIMIILILLPSMVYAGIVVIKSIIESLLKKPARSLSPAVHTAVELIVTDYMSEAIKSFEII